MSHACYEKGCNLPNSRKHSPPEHLGDGAGGIKVCWLAQTPQAVTLPDGHAIRPKAARWLIYLGGSSNDALVVASPP